MFIDYLFTVKVLVGTKVGPTFRIIVTRHSVSAVSIIVGLILGSSLPSIPHHPRVTVSAAQHQLARPAQTRPLRSIHAVENHNSDLHVEKTKC